MFSVYLYASFAGTFLILSAFWIFVFAKRIYLIMRYKKGLLKQITDEESRFIHEQYFYHYQTEIRKYTFLIIINMTEVIATIIDLIKSNLNEFSFPNNVNMSIHELEYCDQVNNSMLYNLQFSKSTTRILNVLEATGDSVEIILLTLIACLMLYLIKRIKWIKHSIVNKKTRLYLSCMFLSPLLIMSFASIKSFIIVSDQLFIFLLCVSFYFLIRIFKQFLSALFQQAYQRLAQHGCNKRELRQYKYFKYTMVVIMTGYFIIILATILTKFPLSFTGILFYGKCYFPLDIIPQYMPIHLSDKGIEDFIIVMELANTASKIVTSFGVIVALFPIFVLTVVVWANILYKHVRSKRTNIYRYNMESLKSRLIVKN